MVHPANIERIPILRRGDLLIDPQCCTATQAGRVLRLFPKEFGTLYLLAQYPTQGWINEKLSSATIRDGKCENLRYLRYKNCRGSQRFFKCMNALIRAVTEQTPEQAA